jgi:hypothetical protein
MSWHGMTKVEDSNSGNAYRTLAFRVFVMRIANSVVWSLLLPGFLSGSLALMQHWISPTDSMGERLSYGITNILAMTTLKLSVGDQLPKTLKKQTFIERYLIAVFLFIGISMGSSIIPFQFCKPRCEAIECEADGFYKRRQLVDLAADAIAPATECECSCAVDGTLLVVLASLWALVSAQARVCLAMVFGLDAHCGHARRCSAPVRVALLQ